MFGLLDVMELGLADFQNRHLPYIVLTVKVSNVQYFYIIKNMRGFVENHAKVHIQDLILNFIVINQRDSMIYHQSKTLHVGLVTHGNIKDADVPIKIENLPSICLIDMCDTEQGIPKINLAACKMNHIIAEN